MLQVAKQAVVLLMIHLLAAGGSPSWRRYAPHAYQMLGESEGYLADGDSDLAEVDETLSQLRWPQRNGEPTIQYKKAIMPVRFHEARMRPGSVGQLPLSARIDDVSETSSPETEGKGKEQEMEGMWMKKKGTRKVTLKKREGRLSPEEQQKLLGELGNILKDDDQGVRKKKATSQQGAANVKRQINESDVEEEGKTEKNEEPTEKQNFHDWLKQEYLRNMALSFATAKKKRSPRDELRHKRKALSDELSSGLDREFFDPETLDAVKERLKSIENAVLADAIQKIILRARDDSASEVSNAGGQKIANRLAEAYYIEKLKQTLDKLPHNWGKFREEEESETLPYKKRGNGNLAEVLPVMAPTDDKRQLDTDDITNDEDSLEELEVCPELQLLTSDCSALEGFLPISPMTSTIRHFCNKHEVCYTCGEAFGLTSSDCDGLFLRDTMTLCRATGLCHGDGQLLLQPLHERRVFYKRSVPPICHSAPCVQAFLLQQ